MVSSMFSFTICTNSKAEKEKGEANRGDKRNSGKVGVDRKVEGESSTEKMEENRIFNQL